MYMNIMLELVEVEYNNNKADNEKLKITPEGMYYYRMTDPYVEAGDEAGAEEARKKNLSLTGLVNDDNEKFDYINRFAVYKAKDIAGHIMSGEINKNPMVADGRSTCEFCVYKEVCRFDKKYGGNKERFLRYDKKDENIVYDKIREILDNN